jgi:23S rRNA pseudouridine2605 synthase
VNERLQKVLAQAGVASRRASEKLIAEGRVMINGRTVREMGVKADPAVDDIRVDGRRVKAAQRHRYILLNKPPGYVTTRSDPQRRPTVIDLLHGVREYVYPVGRLDYDTDGLLLLTNDGDLAARLTHPRHGVERTYEARVAGMPDRDAIDRLRNGIPLDGRRTLPANVVLLTKAPPLARRGPREGGTRSGTRKEPEGILLITIREGRNRQVRRMCEAVGHPVRKLTRKRIGPLSDRRLKPGEWRELTAAEVAALRAAAESGAPTRPPSPPEQKRRTR